MVTFIETDSVVLAPFVYRETETWRRLREKLSMYETVVNYLRGSAGIYVLVLP